MVDRRTEPGHVLGAIEVDAFTATDLRQRSVGLADLDVADPSLGGDGP